MPASLPCRPQYFCGPCPPHGLSVYRWVLELGCPGGMSAPPTAAQHGEPAGPTGVDTASLGQAACRTLSSLAPGSCRDVGELFLSELERNQPQTKHPAKFSGERSWRWREAPLAAFPCCGPRDHSPSLPPVTPRPARSCDRMVSHPHWCRAGTHSLGQGHKHMEEG